MSTTKNKRCYSDSMRTMDLLSLIHDRKGLISGDILDHYMSLDEPIRVLMLHHGMSLLFVTLSHMLLNCYNP